MRFYRIDITDAKSGKLLKRWTTLTAAGTTDAGALKVELDIPTAPFTQPAGDAFVRVWGIERATIAQNFNGQIIEVFGGMAAGLPLANPAQQGRLVRGMIWQALANWEGTSMTLDLLIKPTGVSFFTPANLVLEWLAGTPLAAALDQALARAFPNVPRNIQISPNLVLPHDEHGFYNSIEELASFLESLTYQLFGATYYGVQIVLQNNEFVVFDGSGKTSPKTLQFADLVGQPTWINPYTLQITTVLRGDLQVNNYIALPSGFVLVPGALTVAPSSYSQYTPSVVFQGSGLIIAARHIGDSRDPNGRNWVSVFNVVYGSSTQGIAS